MTEDDKTVQELLAGPALDPREIEAQYPNARRILKGGLFISHDGRDFARIRDTIVHPVVHDRFMDGYFLHNRKSGGSVVYRELVRTALHYLDKFLLVVSSNSLMNVWVHAEVATAAELGRPIVACLLDGSRPESIHHSLRRPWYRRRWSRVVCVDFRGSLERAQMELGHHLDSMLARSPYERRPW